MVGILDQPCQRCGWKYPGFHICAFDFSTVEGVMEATKVEPAKVTKSGKRKPPSLAHQSVGGSVTHKERIAAGVRAAYARDPKRVERNKEIIRLYEDEEFSMRAISEKVGADFRTVANVLHTASDRGEIVLRRSTPRRAGG